MGEVTSYIPPIGDIKFVLRHIAGLKDLDDDLVTQVLEQAGRFASEVLAPLNQSGDARGCRIDNGEVVTPPGFREAYARFVEAGWNGVGFDPAYGGQGLPGPMATAVSEMWHAANLAWGLCSLLTQCAAEFLQQHGDADQRARYLHKLVSGKWTGTMCMTEAHAGSDVGAINTRAARRGDGYVIQGNKIFISWGEHDMAANIVHFVLARIDGAPPGVKGISLFLVPKFLLSASGEPDARNEVHAVSIEHKLGLNASPTVALAFGEGASAELIGTEHGGMALMFTMMNTARLAVGLEGVAIAERAYQLARGYARERRQGRHPDGAAARLIDHPDVRRMLMTMKAETEAMRALVYYTAGVVARGDETRTAFLTPVVKGFCGEVCAEVASLGIQIHGGAGYIEETGAAQYLRDSRVVAIYEGTTGIQAHDLAQRKLPAENGRVAIDLIAEMKALDVPLGKAGAGLVNLRTSLRQAVARLEKSTAWMVRAQGEVDAAAGASEYLRLFGRVFCGYLMARSALASLSAGPPDKLVTARFYAERLLPEADALTAALTSGGESVMELSEDEF